MIIKYQIIQYCSKMVNHIIDCVSGCLWVNVGVGASLILSPSAVLCERLHATDPQIRISYGGRIV